MNVFDMNIKYTNYLMRPAFSRVRTNTFVLSLVAVLVSGLNLNTTVYAATLPVACASTACGAGVTWNGAEVAPNAVGNTLTINQQNSRAIYNWSSFNIGADGKVVFNQPNVNSIALNRIYDANPTQIYGSLQANGQLYLLNQNGFLFGSTARVNTSGLLASSLNLTDDIFNNGLLSANKNFLPALQATGNESSIVVQQGAKIVTNADGQRILLSAKKIDNNGEIIANGGQIILAAGEKLYVNASADPALRGLLVEVDGGGGVTNTGSVTAERGNITAVGLAINQNGRMSATTSVSENGSIRLIARDRVSPNITESGEVTWLGHRGGALTLGMGSVTEVNAVSDHNTTAVNEQEQLPSTIDFIGQTIELQDSSQVMAAGGKLNIVAATDPGISHEDGARDKDARIHINSGALIDLSGNTENTSVTRNLVSVELRGNELADSPLQRDGVLRGKTVVVDARVGTPLANVEGSLNLIGRTVLERTSKGGSVTLDSAGDVVIESNATVNVSGGAVNYEGGFMKTTQLIKADGSTVDIGKATADANYISLVNPLYKLTSDRWGIVKNVVSPNLGAYESGYVQGADAGSIKILGNAIQLDGNFIGFAVNGSNQRNPSSMAKGGQFIVGVNSDLSKALSFRAPSIELTNYSPHVSVDIASSLPEDQPLILSTGIFNRGFTRVQLASDKSITIDSNAPINMQGGGSLELNAPSIEINSDINSVSGQLSANAVTAQLTPVKEDNGIYIADGVVIDVSGTWVNDTLVPLNSQPKEAVFTNGGSISLQQSAVNGTLSLGDTVSLLANGGAWLKRTGSAVGGKGGSISIKSNNINTADLNQNIKLGSDLLINAFGVQGATGGVFNLRVPRLEIVDDTSWLHPQQISSLTTSSALRVGSSLFSDFGFSNFNLQADSHALSADSSKTILSIAPNAEINLTPLSLLLNADASDYASGISVSNISTSTELPANKLSPSSLTLSASTLLGDRKSYGGIKMSTGSKITGPTDSTINMVSMGDLSIDGEIDISSGNVNLKVIKPVVDNEQQFENRQLTLHSNAVIDVSGGAILNPNDTGLRQGTVSDGGKVALQADIGSVSVEKDALINISGAQATLDIQGVGSTKLTPTLITTAAGNLSVRAAEVIALQGELTAHGGNNASTENTGGSLDISLTRQLPISGADTFNKSPREIQLVAGSQQSSGLGNASISSDYFKDSGIVNLSVAADDQISINSGVDIDIKHRVVLDAPVLKVVGDGDAKIEAEYLSIGPRQSVSQRPVVAEGSGALLLTGQQQLDVTGSLALQNRLTTLSTQGVINLEGYGASTNAPGGFIGTKGDLNLEANLVMPTTGSNFTIKALGDNSTVYIKQKGSTPISPVSVAGVLDINATNITQEGTLIAPFGSISLDATQSLILKKGSVTSVSGNGSVLPYGRVDNGTSWVWGINPEYATEVSATPQRQVHLSANTAALANGAIIDVSGGGDLLAYQFTPGTGGKVDALAGNAKGMYAIIPAWKGNAVPYDPMMWAGSDIVPGDSIYLANGSDIPAGVYQLMPARYALLPGAYLVSSASGFQDIDPNTVGLSPDGSRIVPGYKNFGPTLNEAARFNGYIIRPGSYARKLAQYDDQLASKFFADHVSESVSNSLLTKDAGTLAIAVEKSLEALSTVRGQGAYQGLNSTVEIQAPVIKVGSGNESSSEGDTLLSSQIVKDWHVGSLLLGGQRDSAGAIHVGSNSVTLLAGTELVADEVILSAKKDVNVESGATLASSSGKDANVHIDESKFSEARSLKINKASSDQAAVLAVSDLNYLVTERDQVSENTGLSTDDKAEINLAMGSVVATGGSITADSRGKISLNGIQAQHASWSLGAQGIDIGEAAQDPSALLIGDDILKQLGTARDVTIKSTSDINLQKTLTLGGNGGINTLHLSAERINNLAGDTNHTINAHQIVLSGLSSTESKLQSGEGSVEFNAQEITLNQGRLGFSGFKDTSLISSGLILGQDEGGIVTAGDMKLTASALTTKSGAHTYIGAKNGELQLNSLSASIPQRQSFDLGGTLVVEAKNIIDQSNIIMPSGVVRMSASEGMDLQANATIDVAGANPQLSSSGSNGGLIELSSMGDINTSEHTLIDVSAGHGADSGVLAISSSKTANLKGMVNGASGVEGKGGAFSVDAGSIDDFGGLVQKVQNAGFTQQQLYRVGEGDLELAADRAIHARKIELTADQGTVKVNGSLVARSEDERSQILVNANSDISIGSTALIDAGAADAIHQKSGTIEISAIQGHIDIDQQAQIKSSGKDESGVLIVRASATGDDVKIISLPNDLSKVDLVSIEPVNSFTLNKASPTASDFEQIRSSIDSYLLNAEMKISNRLGLGNYSNLEVRPYADVTRVGDLSLSGIDYSQWRFGEKKLPVDLSIRATGDIAINGVISDGFTGNGKNLDILNQSSGSFNFVAGADLQRANNQLSTSGATHNFIFSNGSILRTGTGNINISASGDVIFGDQSSIYTGGIKGYDTQSESEGNSIYADRGGTIKINAGRDIKGSVVNQAVNDWQTHLVNVNSDTPSINWGVDYNSFSWNVGTLGGGDVIVNAAKNITDLSAAVADSQVQDINAIHALGGGNLDISTGQDVGSGYFYVGRGKGSIRAWGSFGSSGNRTLDGKVDGENLDTLLVSGDASYSVSSTNNLSLEGLLHNPALFFTRPSEQEIPLFINRYGNKSSLNLQTTGGAVNIKAGNFYRYNEFGSYEGNDDYASALYPSSLNIKTFSGDVSIQNSPVLSPSPLGNINIYAAQNIKTDGVISMSDTLTLSPTVTNPSLFSDFVNNLRDSSAELIHSADAQVATIAAGRDIVNLQVALPKAVHINAGRDIIDLSVQGQQLGVATNTVIQAGRDVLDSVNGDTREIAIGGTGVLQVIAGRDINLGYSKGIYTTGNLRNGNLPADSGAQIVVIAGLSKSFGINQANNNLSKDFIDAVISPDKDLQDKLINYIALKTGNTALTFESASQDFRALDRSEQIPFAVNILFAELVKSGRETNEMPQLAFKRGYAALENLFPGSQSTNSPFNGNVSLPFSRIYSLDGGDISVLAPGGKVDVGLANTPASLAKIIGNRPASELGIVAQQSGDVKIMADQDVLVNTSRVFTLGGGDIAIWSSTGNIDAGKGAKTAISAPPPTLIVDANGNVSINFASAVAGSGIRTISTGKSITPGDVDLIAPAGFVNAGDAGIGSSGNLNIAAQQVVGLDNIQVGGTSTGVPPETGGLGASLSGVTSSANSSTSAASSSVADAASQEKNQATMADAALSWLEVFVIGLGEDACKQDDLECLKRQTLN